MSAHTDELKLSRVVLFKVGIGIFQKKGKIDLAKSKSIKLSVKNTVMNDLLKTFSIMKTSGDLMVSGISYEAKDTNRKKLLADSDINLPETNVYSAILQQLRGNEILLHLGERKVQGKVVGIQSIPEAPTGQAILVNDYVILMAEGEEIIPLPINDITNLQIIDSKIKTDFNYFLEIIVGQNKEKNKDLTIFLEGSELSEYLINYMQEIPAWKTSYRINLSLPDEKKTPKKTTKKKKDAEKIAAELEGWAIIDNVLNEDWENVDLTLVTGLPVSFHYDSYSPAWITRPIVERKTDLGLKVAQFEKEMSRGLGSLKKGKKMARSSARSRRGPAGPPGAPPPVPAAPRASIMTFGALADEGDIMDEMPVDSAFEGAGEAKKGAGLALRYHIQTPVHVKRNNSSLIPLLAADFKTEMVSVYNEKINRTAPLKTLIFSNPGSALEEGPVSLYFNGTFIGEAMLPFAEEGQEIRLPFAVDQAIQVTKKELSRSQNFHTLRIGDDIQKRYFRETTTRYALKNNGEDPTTIIIEHSKRPGFELISPAKPRSESAHFLRFQRKIKGQSSIELEIDERKLEYSYESYDNLSLGIIQEWLKKKIIGKEEFEYLKSLITLTNDKHTLHQKIENIKRKIAEIFKEQERIRKNLASLKTSAGEKKLREKYIHKFDMQESTLELLRTERAGIKSQMAEVQGAIDLLNKNWGETQLKKEKAKEKHKSEAK